MSRRFVFSAILGGFILTGLLLYPVQAVNVTLPREDGKIIAAIRITKKDLICLAYRHSVELTRVQGYFKAGPGSSLLAVTTRMESVGTGLPNAFPERTTMRNGWIEVDEGDKPVSSLRFFFEPINQTRLTVADRPIDLSTLTPGTLLEISVEHTPAVVWGINTISKKR